ncbi:MAG: serine/threonine protein kinase [Actinomycetota bacterium]|nr:serine/threonine protein kinase [Actinomycetota bacterium]
MAEAVASREEAVAAGHDLVAGRYRPLRPLGSGGSGSVWLARDEEGARDVALKVVRREGKAASRAEREVEAATRLRHPRCLRALALDRDEEHVYVAYEYVRGRTLREAMRAGELDDRSAVEAAAQVLEGLAHAHGKGVVHRDVKPANVMLEDGGDVSVRLLDFGLARVDEADPLTAAGDVPGTLAYIAPERLDGVSASGPADVWSVGVLLWEALAGWHPFASASPVETARRIRQGARPLAGSRPDLPPELCALVDRMLVRDPARRPPAKRLADALRDAFASRAKRPRPASSIRVLRGRAAHAALAAAYTGGCTGALPFFPRGWPFLLGGVVAVAALRAPRLGLALALAAPVLPLGNLSLGLAIVYAGLAVAWLAAFARDPENGLLVAAGPPLAAVAALGLAPLVALRVHGPLRRGLVAGGAVAVAGGAAAIAGLPFPAGGTPVALGLEGLESPTATARVLADALAASPGIAVESVVFALAAIALPLARRLELWGVAIWGSAFLAAALLLPVPAGATANELALAPGISAATIALGAAVVRAAAGSSSRSCLAAREENGRR